jgi:hypothetical protein
MKTTRFVLPLFLCAALAVQSIAHAEPSVPPGTLAPQLVLDPAVDAALRRGRAERIAGTVFLVAAGVGLLATVGLAVWSTRCDTTPSHDSDCSVALGGYAVLAGAATLVEGGVGTALLATGLVRERDAARLRVLPTVSSRGGGLALGFDF